MNETMMIAVGFIALLMAIVGTITYGKVHRKYEGIMGAPGAYFITIGFFMLAGAIGELVNKISGKPSMATTGEIVMSLVVLLAAVAYAVIAIIRCDTVAQRIFLPLAALLLAFGWAWRFLLSILLHVPMGGSNEETAPAFPQFIYDSSDNPWELINNGTDNANYYCQKTGETRNFHITEFQDGSPSGFYRR